MKRLALALVAMPLLLTSTAQAQGDWWWGASYTVSVPFGNTKDFVDATSWRGVTLEARKKLSRNATWGLLFGWYVFDQSQVATVDFGGVTVTGKPYTYINTFPIQATAHYYLGQPRKTRLHVGGAAGVTIDERRLDVGLYTVQESKTVFSLAPEIGVSTPLGYSLRGVLSVRYNYEAKSGNREAQQYLGISAGLAWN